jgi:hypothetical protein
MDANTLRWLYDFKGIEPVLNMLPLSSDSKMLKALPIENLGKGRRKRSLNSLTKVQIISGV